MNKQHLVSISILYSPVVVKDGTEKEIRKDKGIGQHIDAIREPQFADSLNHQNSD